ncbi:CBS domain-containing protein [Nocardia gipuzkoensis]|jgi:CBS domain-containing protein|uniref:CBS domain-containing protein n=1 Tax=Nocardia TaxID=1817 RepID=UPI0015EE8985|nr:MULTISPECIES: CBS domain-containing protein [Nocardia]MBF6221661.1 CBS domain-containing protein [Nocardia abscessus]MBF6475576.1 CBS domain-containing protein [Nocardia abscessus]MDE1674044.1 CBS domain-containing protein [Nocardia gipuzkoensis]UGT67091.1 CBS domain-containing protein [Nocardia gipuzkoensis]
MTTARDIMTPNVECVRSSDTVVAAAQRMAELNVGALPICGEDDKLKGMLTDRDIVVKVIAQRKDPLGVDAGELGGELVTVDADDDVRKVMSVMSQHQVRRVPVLEQGRLVGIIAQADVATMVDNTQSGSTVEAISTDF